VAAGWNLLGGRKPDAEARLAAARIRSIFRWTCSTAPATNASAAKKLANAIRTAVARAGLWRGENAQDTSGIGVELRDCRKARRPSGRPVPSQVEGQSEQRRVQVKRLTLAMGFGRWSIPTAWKAPIRARRVGMSLALFEKAPLKDGRAAGSPTFQRLPPLR